MNQQMATTKDSIAESFIKEELFEKYILDNYFPKEDFDLLRKNPSYKDIQEQFNYSPKLPNFQLVDKKSKTTFWVECNYRSYINALNQIQVLEPQQLEHNNSIEEPILYLIGLEGAPDNPNFIYQIPHAEIYPHMYISTARKFLIHQEQY
ncbi:MAG: hypothetical protein COA50_10340 [Flavobacteriaceae bacterium]|nr:MAG: hypothetical protein COA50_10340 [Flavobacteriaceae bacterium]